MTRNINTSKTTKATFRQSGVYNNGAGLIPFNDSTVTDYIIVTESRVGGNTANYHSPKRVGSLKPTSFSYSKSVQVGETGSSRYYDTVLKSNQYGYQNTSSSGCRGAPSVPGHRLATQSELDQTIGRASNKLLSNVKSQSINVGQAIAERNQTMRLIGDTAVRLAKSLRSLKKGNLVDAARNLGVGVPKRANSRFKRSFEKRQSDAVSRAWLELQYGWKPLLSDVYGAAEQLAKQSNRRNVVTVKSSENLTVPLSTKTSSSNGKSFRGGSSLKGTMKVDVKFSVTYAVTSPAVASAKEIGLTNPLLIAWELLPFSFVADWFIPLGSYIGNMDATIGCTFESGYRTVFQKAESISNVFGNGLDQYSCQSDFRWEATQMNVKVDRTVLAGFPSPVVPSFKNPVSVTHAANALALLHQLFRK